MPGPDVPFHRAPLEVWRSGDGAGNLALALLWAEGVVCRAMGAGVADGRGNSRANYEEADGPLFGPDSMVL